MVEKKIVVLGTGGTIAGLADNPIAPGHYRAGQVGVGQLLGSLAGAHDVLAGCEVAAEQLAQIDSKDMDFALWALLAQRAAELLAQPDVKGLVITHGTDTLEETAYFLHCVLAARKPVVLTCAMRPANAPDADGPQNLRDALLVAGLDDAAGVLTVCAGQVHGPLEVQKVNPRRLDAFASGEAGPLARIAQGRVERLQPWPVVPAAQPLPAEFMAFSPPGGGGLARPWPWVEIVVSNAGATGAAVDALVASGVQGLVVAATGNGTVHQALQLALQRAQLAGVPVLRSSRCIWGNLGDLGDWGSLQPSAGEVLEAAPGLSPVKARIALILRLMRLPPAALRRAA